MNLFVLHLLTFTLTAEQFFCLSYIIEITVIKLTQAVRQPCDLDEILVNKSLRRIVFNKIQNTYISILFVKHLF